MVSAFRPHNRLFLNLFFNSPEFLFLNKLEVLGSGLHITQVSNSCAFNLLALLFSHDFGHLFSHHLPVFDELICFFHLLIEEVLRLELVHVLVDGTQGLRPVKFFVVLHLFDIRLPLFKRL